jgi:hypothetical protein
MTTLRRRQFLQKTTTAIAALSWVPRHVLGGPRFVPPSERVNIAGIGIGGMGFGDIQEVARIDQNLYALCDVDKVYAAKAFQKFPKAKVYTDYRKLLEQEKEVDAVIVATPDHTHAIITSTAIKAGKHVYCEKPMTHTLFEARTIAKLAKEAKVATQMGNQGHASESIRQFCEWIWDGAIGTVREIHAWTPHAVWPQDIDRPKETPPVPDTLDWDLWLGPAPARPYHPAYLPGIWRGWLDFGTGALGDMGCHVFDPLVWAFKLGHPTSVEASSSIFVPKITWNKERNKETYPRGSIVRYQFPARGAMPPLKLTWYDGGLMPEIPAELADVDTPTEMGDTYGGFLVVGDKGKILAGSHGADPLRLLPEALNKDYPRPAKTLKRSPGHHLEWIQACKGGAPANSNFAEYAGLLTEIVLMGNVAVLTGKKLLWDGPNLKVTNVPEANALLHYEYRKGWAL